MPCLRETKLDEKTREILKDVDAGFLEKAKALKKCSP